MRVLAIAHANWSPNKHSVLAVSTVAKVLGVGKATVSGAITELVSCGFLTVEKPPVSPRGQARGRAGVYRVAGRTKGEEHRVFDPGDRRLQGCYRIDCDKLRELAEMLSPTEARILFCDVLPCDRDKHGQPAQHHIVALSGRLIADNHLDMSARTADAGIVGLTDKGLLRVVTPAAGRRAATYEPDGLATSYHLQGRRRSKGALQGPPGNQPNASRTAQKSAKSGRNSDAPAVLLGASRGNEPAAVSPCAAGNPLASDPGLAAALRLVAAGPVPRDSAGPVCIPYAIATSLLARGWITVTRKAAAGDARARQRFYEITPAGRAALAQHDQRADATHGTLRVGAAKGKMWYDYKPEPGYVGPDAFTIEPGKPGSPQYPIEVQVSPAPSEKP